VSKRSTSVRRASALAGAALVAALAPAVAHAGDWMQVSCVNPNGSAAPSQGWTSATTGTPEAGSFVDTNCSPGSPMAASLSTAAPASTGTQEALQYTPPTGSTLAGGSVDVNLFADSSGPGGSGDAVLYTPSFSYDSSDVFFQCAQSLGLCTHATFSGVQALPANRGGNFYASAYCGGSGSCTSSTDPNAYAYAQVVSADLLLFNGSSPAASGFGGSLLSTDATGTADVSFTATDPGGPGVYLVTVSIDGHDVYGATPDTNSGHCVSAGTDTASGAPMFDWRQPCPTTEFVDIPVNTAGLGAGQHQLKVTVTDAAQNTSTVLDQTIGTDTTATPTPTPSQPGHQSHVRATLLIVSRYSGVRTRLIRITARNLPGDAHVTVRCRGPHCPRPSARTASAAHLRGLWKALTREVFTAGDRVIFTFTAPGLLPERTEILIRKDAKPVAKRL
jgi:hypothetical protein